VNVVDSSAWLEYFADAPNADVFAEPIESPEDLVVPAITVYEVFERVAQQRGERTALGYVGVLLRSRVVDVTTELAVEAARLGLRLGLPIADSLILATARAHGATLWTQDADFDGVEGVRFVPVVRLG
jgi:predicted nucleic acid-binding protein